MLVSTARNHFQRLITLIAHAVGLLAHTIAKSLDGGSKVLKAVCGF